MHYRNGREAHNGDKVVQLADQYDSAGEKTGVRIAAVGILFDAKPGNNYCNGSIAPLLGGPVVGACICDCVHAEDLSALLASAGLDKRPAGK